MARFGTYVRALVQQVEHDGWVGVPPSLTTSLQKSCAVLLRRTSRPMAHETKLPDAHTIFVGVLHIMQTLPGLENMRPEPFLLTLVRSPEAAMSMEAITASQTVVERLTHSLAKHATVELLMMCWILLRGEGSLITDVDVLPEEVRMARYATTASKLNVGRADHQAALLQILVHLTTLLPSAEGGFPEDNLRLLISTPMHLPMLSELTANSQPMHVSLVEYVMLMNTASRYFLWRMISTGPRMAAGELSASELAVGDALAARLPSLTLSERHADIVEARPLSFAEWEFFLSAVLSLHPRLSQCGQEILHKVMAAHQLHGRTPYDGLSATERGSLLNMMIQQMFLVGRREDRRGTGWLRSLMPFLLDPQGQPWAVLHQLNTKRRHNICQVLQRLYSATDEVKLEEMECLQLFLFPEGQPPGSTHSADVAGVSGAVGNDVVASSESDAALAARDVRQDLNRRLFLWSAKTKSVGARRHNFSAFPAEVLSLLERAVEVMAKAAVLDGTPEVEAGVASVFAAVDVASSTRLLLRSALIAEELNDAAAAAQLRTLIIQWMELMRMAMDRSPDGGLNASVRYHLCLSLRQLYGLWPENTFAQHEEEMERMNTALTHFLAGCLRRSCSLSRDLSITRVGTDLVMELEVLMLSTRLGMTGAEYWQPLVGNMDQMLVNAVERILESEQDEYLTSLMQLMSCATTSGLLAHAPDFIRAWTAGIKMGSKRSLVARLPWRNRCMVIDVVHRTYKVLQPSFNSSNVARDVARRMLVLACRLTVEPPRTRSLALLSTLHHVWSLCSIVVLHPVPRAPVDKYLEQLYLFMTTHAHSMAAPHTISINPTDLCKVAEMEVELRHVFQSVRRAIMVGAADEEHGLAYHVVFSLLAQRSISTMLRIVKEPRGVQLEHGQRSLAYTNMCLRIAGAATIGLLPSAEYGHLGAYRLAREVLLGAMPPGGAPEPAQMQLMRQLMQRSATVVLPYAKHHNNEGLWANFGGPSNVNEDASSSSSSSPHNALLRGSIISQLFVHQHLFSVELRLYVVELVERHILEVDEAGMTRNQAADLRSTLQWYRVEHL